MRRCFFQPFQLCVILGTVVLLLGANVCTLAGEISEAGGFRLTVTNVQQIRLLVQERGRMICSLALTGVVSATNSPPGTVVFQDDTGAEKLVLDAGFEALKPGQQVRIEGEECLVFQRRSGVVVSTREPVVNNDGNHSLTENTGEVWAAAGWYPLRLPWFNAQRSRALEVDYQGPGLPRQKIPDTSFYQNRPTDGGKTNGEVHGLAYRCYEGSWQQLPDFAGLVPVKAGRTANFDLEMCSRDEFVGLEFTGWLELPRTGPYTFYLNSDDGSQLFLGAGRLRSQVLREGNWPEPISIAAGQSLSATNEFQWAEVDGLVKSVGRNGEALYLDLVSESGRMSITVLNGEGRIPDSLLGCRIRIQGVVQSVWDPHGDRRAGQLLVPGLEQVAILHVPEEVWQRYPVATLTNLTASAETNSAGGLMRIAGLAHFRPEEGFFILGDNSTGNVEIQSANASAAWDGRMVEVLGYPAQHPTGIGFIGAACRLVPSADADARGLPTLTTIEEVRQLKPEEARKNYPVRIRGVVTLAEARRWGSIHDGLNGINVLNLNSGNPQPAPVGELCEIEGETRPAGFGPMIAASKRTALGDALLPEPLHPSFEQLMNGSLDGQWVEVEGGVLSQTADAEGTTLLIGMIGGQISVLIPRESQNPALVGSFTDAIVRVRGVVMPTFNEQKQIQSVRIFISSSRFLTVTEPPPLDFFAGPAKSVRELLYFDPRAAFVRRVKVSGQVVHVGKEAGFLMDERDGLKFIPKEPIAAYGLGDWVEVVGYPELGSAVGAPMLREAKVRTIGPGILPAPKSLSAADLLSARNDATLVSVEGRLVSVTANQGDQILEFQVGTRMGTARLGSRVVELPPPGSLLRLTGVYVGHGGNRAAGQVVDSFELLLNSPQDIATRSLPPWWTFRRTMIVLGILGSILALTVVWITLLRRQVDERTAQLAAEIEERQHAEQQQALERERTRVAQDLHDDLGSGLTEVGILGALVKNPEISSEQKAGYLDRVIDVSRGLVSALDEIVWTVNPRYDSVMALGSYCSLYAQRFLELSSIRCFLEVGQNLPEHPLDSKTRYGLFLAFKEALNNIIRHAQATEAHLRMNVEAGELQFEIADNGRGFDLAASRPGMDGVPGMQARLAKLGGECRIESQPGRGTKVLFRLPLHSVPAAPAAPE